MTDPDRLGPEGDARAFRFDLAGALEQVASRPTEPDLPPVTTPAADAAAEVPDRRRPGRWRRRR